MKREFHIDIEHADVGTSAIDILKVSTDLSKTVLKQVMSKGALWLSNSNSTQRLRRADKKMNQGDMLHLYYDDEVLAQIPTPPVLVADEAVYSIWVKPYGMFCQGSKWSDHCTINRWVETNLSPQRPAFIVHRLDRAASGLVIIAHKKRVAAYFSKLFESRSIKKQYQAVVHGHFTANKKIESEIDGKPSISHISVLNYDHANDQTLVQVQIETGRKHQIRRHLSESGFPIVGDRLYGRVNITATSDEVEDLCLTSCYIAFKSPLDDTLKEYRLPAEYE